MRRYTFVSVVLLCCLFLPCVVACSASVSKKQAPVAQKMEQNFTQYVNPFIGTAPTPTAHAGFSFDTGDVVPDATYPLGMVQWGPDTKTRIPGHYYYPDKVIDDFSVDHFSGRGCGAWGDFPLMPFIAQSTSTTSEEKEQVPSLSSLVSPFSHQQETAHPGYYQVYLEKPQVNVEFSATAHGGVGRFTYPASKQASMLIDAGGSTNGSTHASVHIDASTQEITGQTTSRVGCGTNLYTIYFIAHFDRAFANVYGNGKAAAVVSFDTTKARSVQFSMAISFVSVANARLNMQSEIGSSSFARIQQKADRAWNARLESIEVQGGTRNEQTIFYTALYHTFFHPNIFNDVNGQYLGFDNKVHVLVPGQHAQYENIPGWDQYRALTALRALIAPTEASDLAQSLVNDALQGDGHLPRWEEANVDSHGMNGDSADVEIATMYAYGDTNFASKAALHAMVNGQPHVREGLDDYIGLGYVPAIVASNSAVITQEYTNDDFALAMFAKALGEDAIYRTYLQRSGNWRNLLNKTSGYVQPRNANGSWTAHFSPTSGHGFQETDATQSTWMEIFDTHDLFSALGGDQKVVKRLDTFFTQLNDGPAGKYVFMGNEPDIETPWEYDFAGAPAYTQSVVRRIQTQLYAATPSGLPGNDDGGTMSAWYIFSAIGLYPALPGVGGFVLGSPLFPSITFHLADGKVIHITAPTASDRTPYVQTLTLNGHATTQVWLPWSSVKNGATLNFTLVDHATSWGSAPEDAPPSFSPPA